MNNSAENRSKNKISQWNFLVFKTISKIDIRMM
jgi:hypothetical protein